MKIKLLLHTKKYLVSLFIFLFSVNHLMSNYSIDSLVVDTVGNKSTGGTYELFSAGGQSVIGNSSGGSYNMETGFIGATDNVPPTDIVNLTALQGLSVGQIILKWTAHGDDKDIGNIWQGQYEIKYTSMAIITNSNYDNPPDPTYTITISTSYSTPLQEHTTTVYNLKQGTSYWFAIKMRDEANNWSVWNSTKDVAGINTAAYTWAQGIWPIKNLSASTGSYVGSIELTWTYPETLVAGSSYYIQYSTYSGESWNVNNAQVIVSTSVTAFTSATQIVGGFDVGRGYYPSYNIISPDYYFTVWITTGTDSFSENSNVVSTYANTPDIGTNTQTDFYDGWKINYDNNNGKESIKDISLKDTDSVYIVGYFSGCMGIRKYSSLGHVLWTKYYLASNPNDIVIDDTGNVYTVGFSYTGIYNELYIRKYDNEGQYLWSLNYLGSSNNGALGNGIAIDNSRNIYIVGAEKNSIGFYDILVQKYDTNGLIQWTTTYNNPSNHNDNGRDISVDSSNNVYVIGDEVRSDIGELTNVWIRKYDTDGLVQWTTTYNNVDNGNDCGRGIAVNNLGNICATARIDTISGIHIWVSKYDTDGLILWTTTYNNPSDNLDFGLGIDVNSIGNVFAGGEEYRPDLGQNENLWLRKYSQSYLTQPSIATINCFNSSITFNWNDSNYESSYTVKNADNFIISTLNPNTTNYTLSGLSPNSSTSVYITAYNTWASSSSALITTYTLSNPTTGSYIISSDDYKIKLGWGSNNNPSYTKWGILRSTDTNFISTTTIKDFTDNYTQTTYSDKNVLPETTYYYKICAYNNNQVITNYDTVISTLTLPKDEKIVINEIASCEGTDMIEFYVSQTGAYGGYTVYEGPACIKTFPNSGDWVNGNMINGTYIMLYLNSPAGTDETEINGSLIKIYSDYTGINATDNIIYLSSSNGLGFKADGVVSATSTVVDIVAYANQDLTELSSAYKNNIASMTTIGLWNYEGIEPKQIDCVNSRGLTTAGRGIARDDVSRRSGDKYDWMYMNILSTGGINIATTSVSGLGGASTSTPTG